MSSSGATSLNDGHDAEKKAAVGSVATPAGTDVSDGNVTSSNPQYERYLDLHRLFQGPARARFIRKREWNASIIPRLQNTYTNATSWQWTGDYCRRSVFYT